MQNIMLTNETKIRVRYGETDQMGYLYHGNYAQYYEIGRTELMRSLDLSYDDLEKKGIILPVYSLNVKFLKPAKYDEILTIRTTVEEMPSVRIHFYYQIINEKNELINTGDTVLVFVDNISRKPVRPPQAFINKIETLLKANPNTTVSA